MVSNLKEIASRTMISVAKITHTVSYFYTIIFSIFFYLKRFFTSFSGTHVVRSLGLHLLQVFGDDTVDVFTQRLLGLGRLGVG